MATNQDTPHLSPEVRAIVVELVRKYEARMANMKAIIAEMGFDVTDLALNAVLRQCEARMAQMKAIVAEMGIEVIDLPLAEIETENLKGIPYTDCGPETINLDIPLAIGSLPFCQTKWGNPPVECGRVAAYLVTVWTRKGAYLCDSCTWTSDVPVLFLAKI